jgi:Flp pilus assembly pilin Flp
MKFFLEWPAAAYLRRRSGKKGQTLVEYALILAVLTILLIAAFKLLGNNVTVIFSSMTTLLDTAQANTTGH